MTEKRKVAKKVTQKRSTDLVRGVWGIVCSLSSIDQERNNVSLFNIINQINVDQSDFAKVKTEGSDGLIVPIPHELFLTLRRMTSHELCDVELRIDIKISLVDPDNKILVEMLCPITFRAGARNLRHRIAIDAFKVTKSGDYEYRVGIKQPNSGNFTESLAVPFFVNEC